MSPHTGPSDRPIRWRTWLVVVVTGCVVSLAAISWGMAPPPRHPVDTSRWDEVVLDRSRPCLPYEATCPRPAPRPPEHHVDE